MTDVREELLALAKANPVPSVTKMDRRLQRMERMAKFYSDKAPEAPEKQGKMFREFVSALIYAVSILKMYRRLTRKLALLAEEAGNGTETPKTDS